MWRKRGRFYDRITTMNIFQKRLRSGAVTLLLLLASMALAFLVLEFGLRLALFGSLQWRQSGHLPFIRVPHSELGWLPAPNQVAAEEALEYQHLTTTNSKGLRDTHRAYEKPPGAYRIVVLGDSYMEATHVPEGEGFPQVLEALLAARNVEVINLGVGGYATTAAWLYLRSEGMKYEPDLVLLGFYAENDVHGNSPELSRLFWGEDNIRYYGQPYALWDSDNESFEIRAPDYERSYAGYQERLAAYSPRLYQLDALRKSLTSHLFQQMRLQLYTRVRPPGYDVNIHFGCYLTNFSHVPEDSEPGPDAYQELWDDAWAITKQQITAINDTARKQGVHFAFFNAPARIQFESRYQEAVAERFPALSLDVDLPERRLGAFAARENIPFVDISPPFREADAAGRVVNYNHDSHWNAAGHRLAATAVVAWLDEENLLPKP